MTFNCSLNNGHPVTEFKSILMAEILPLHRLGEKKMALHLDFYTGIGDR